MHKELTQSSDFFGSNLIDLSFKADRESKAFTSRLLWENLALKIVTKLKLLVDRGFNRAVKHRIEAKIRNKQALSPNDLLMYRYQYWEETGTRNYNKIIQSMKSDKDFNNAKGTNAVSNLLPKLLFKELFHLHKHGRLPIQETTYCQDFTTAKNEIYFFFDSYYFFNGGHVAIIEQTIDNLQSTNCDGIFIFLIDRNMVLFPQLSNLILKKIRNRIVFDCTNNPIKLSISPLKPETIRQLAANHSINLSNSIINVDYIYNPNIEWKSYPYTSYTKYRKAWSLAFNKNKSIDIINQTLTTLSFPLIHSEYVVIHARNSALMSDSTRNTKPLNDRADLFKGIFQIGLQVIVLGVMEPSSKFKHPNVIYADDLGPISDDLQIHILNGAIGVIGSPSGITCLTYCTDTPTLLLDMPFPFCSCYPASNMKALMKRLKTTNNNKIGISKYYDFSQLAHLNEERDPQAESPLSHENIKLECNSDDAILHAFQELLLETYSSTRLQGLNLKKTDESIDTEAMKRDQFHISTKLKTCKAKAERFPYFEISDLSMANWFRD